MCRPLQLLVLAASLCGCAPALDWREVRPEGTDLAAMFPCRPGRAERDINLAGRPLKLTLLSCSAADALFALSFARVSDAQHLESTLEELRLSVARNIDSAESDKRPFVVRGMSPNPKAVRSHVRGRRADGSAVEGEVAVFSIGPEVVQAQVLATRFDADAAQTFLDGLRIRR